MGNALDAAKGNKQSNRSDNAAHHQRVKAKGLVQGPTDGVTLDGIVGEAKGECDKYRKQARHPLAVQTSADVVGWAADEGVTRRALEQLCQRCLDKGRRRAKERNQPHPEDGTRTTHGNGSRYASQIARSHACRHRDGKGLERRDVLLTAL